MKYRLSQFEALDFVLLPLDEVEHDLEEAGTLTVYEAYDNAYATVEPGESFRVGGVPGEHRIGDEEETVDLRFRVKPETKLETDQAELSAVYRRALHTLLNDLDFGAVSSELHGNKNYRWLSTSLRGHIHLLKGMKYFTDSVKSALELYRDTQGEDGMIFGQIAKSSSIQAFGSDGPAAESPWTAKLGGRSMERTPVEADVEALYVEGIYATWKATGDDGWMLQLLDSAIRAIRHVENSPVRWSQPFKLVKRGYTIDCGSVQNSLELEKVGGPSNIDPESTRFGIMFGDCTAMAQAYEYLSEMLEVVDRERESESYRNNAVTMRKRLRDVAWRGGHFHHWTPEDGKPSPELGVDEAAQVSMSHGYSLNRGLELGQIEAVINTYQSFRDALPSGSPGEWYTILPPFENGFQDQVSKWHSWNGGVTTVLAGELARAALVFGFESYGFDILQRVSEWRDGGDETLPGCLPVADTSSIPLSPEPLADGWGAAAVLYACIEGAAGVVDTSSAFHTSEVSPRWMLAGASDAQVCVTYPASDGYVAYEWTGDEDGQTLILTTSGHDVTIRLPIPEGDVYVMLNGEPVDSDLEMVREQTYVTLDLDEGQLYGPITLQVSYA